MTGPGIPWQQARPAALDLEGTGAQDRADEAIPEFADRRGSRYLFGGDSMA
jgi:hypothetical protein